MKPRFKKFFTWSFHRILQVLFRVQRTYGPLPVAPKRLLLLNPTHIGDIIISTSLLGVLKSAYPDIEIGFATATWSNVVVRDHPLIAYTHTIDHWRMSRENVSRFQRLRRYVKTRNQAMREICSIKYDVAICLHPGAIDLLNLAWLAGVPERVAFTRSFWSPLATRISEYPEQSFFLHQGACQAQLLRQLGIENHHFAHRHSSLAPSGPEALQEVSDLIGTSILATKNYTVVHMGAGVAFKELSLNFWRTAAFDLSRDAIVLFTGKGVRENQNVDTVTSGLPNCINACDKLSWKGFVAAIKNAQTLYGVDSMAGHVAGAVGTKCVTVSHGAAGVARWRPEGRDVTVWNNHVSCSPCGKHSGCPEMACLSGISPLLLMASPSRSADPLHVLSQ